MKEDSRLRQLADLLSNTSTGVEGKRVCAIPREQWVQLVQHREEMRLEVLRAAQRMFDYDRLVLSVFSPSGSQTAYDLGHAIRAAAPHVKMVSDWSALLMLMRERGHKVSAEWLAEQIVQHAGEVWRCSRQALEKGVWDTNRRRFPDWQPEGVKLDKYERHYAVAAAAAPWL